MTGMSNYKRLFFTTILLIFLGIGSEISLAEVINSIVARVDDHIITLRDVKIEYNIQKVIFKDEAKKGEELINDMIDKHLLLEEAKKVLREELKQETKTKIENEVKKFESLFSGVEYEDFLEKLEITRDDIFLRYKNIVLIGDFLRQKMHIKKNGSNVDENMILSESEEEKFYLDVKDYIKKLRSGADRISINDTLKETLYFE